MKTRVVNLNDCPRPDVYIGRSSRDPRGFGNPFRVSTYGHGKCIRMFLIWLATGDSQGCSAATQDRRLWILRNVGALRGKTLGCFCAPKPCHGIVLAWLAEHPEYVTAFRCRSTGLRRVVLACGGRDYGDWRRVYKRLDALHKRQRITRLVAGDAQGADSHALAWARARGVARTRFIAHWNRHGSRAGHMRNSRMLRKSKPNLVVAFPGGAGTRDMTHRARFAGVPVVEVFA